VLHWLVLRSLCLCLCLGLGLSLGGDLMLTRILGLEQGLIPLRGGVLVGCRRLQCPTSVRAELRLLLNGLIGLRRPHGLPRSVLLLQVRLGLHMLLWLLPLQRRSLPVASSGWLLRRPGGRSGWRTVHLLLLL
jgi:hypothetical protein